MTFSQDEKLRNWAGNYEYGTNKIYRAAGPDEIRKLLNSHDKLKVLGTRHCFNGIADSKDGFISLDALDQVENLDPAAQTVTVGSRIRYGQLAEYLHKKGWALRNLASLPHISVAGAISTGTHGSGIEIGNLSTAVSGLEIVKASGEVIRLNRKNDPEQFMGAVVSLGCLGVISKITLDIVPTFLMRQDVYENLSFDSLKNQFDVIMGSGYSVSLFTDWQNRNFSEVWIKSKVDSGKTVALPPNFYGARPAKQHLHPIRELSAENCTEQMGITGPWYERLPHFKMGFTPSSGKELQSEYFVPREHAYEAIMAVEKLHDQIFPYIQITEIRTIDEDELWMSPCYKRSSATIHFTWKQDWPAVSKLLPLIEKQLAPFGPRPHWGKLFAMDLATLSASYKKSEDFRHLVKEFDPAGKFINEFTKRYILGS